MTQLFSSAAVFAEVAQQLMVSDRVLIHGPSVQLDTSLVGFPIAVVLDPHMLEGHWRLVTRKEVMEGGVFVGRVPASDLGDTSKWWGTPGV